MERSNSAAAAAAGGSLDFCLSGVGCVAVAAPVRARPQKGQLCLSRPPAPAAAAAAAASEQRGGGRGRGVNGGGGAPAAAAAVPPVPATQARQASAAASDPSALSIGVLGLMALRDRRRQGSADSRPRGARWPASSASVCGSESSAAAAAAAADGAAVLQAPVSRGGGGGGVSGGVHSPPPGELLLNATKLTPAAAVSADGVSRHAPAPPAVYSVPIEEEDDPGCCGGSDAGEGGDGADAGIAEGREHAASCDAAPGVQAASLPEHAESAATQVQVAQQVAQTQEQSKAHVAAATRTAARRVRVVLAREKVERALVCSKLSEAQTEAAAQRRKARGTAWQWRREVYAYNKLLRILEAKKSVLYDEGVLACVNGGV